VKTRRTFSMAALGILAGLWASRGVMAQQSADDQDDPDALKPPRRAHGPGRAATRGIQEGTQTWRLISSRRRKA